MNKRIMKKEKGITLIALIVTIVILIILAGVSINLLIGEDGLIGRAKKGSDTYSQQQAKEKLELVLVDMQVDKIDNKNYNQNEYLTSKIEENEMTVNGDIVFVNEWKFQIDRNVPKIAKALGKIDGNDNTEYSKEFIRFKEFQYTGNEQSIVLEPGKYKIQCYGAGGGYGKYDDSYKNTPGKGAFTEGILEITETTTLYIYVGQRGGDAPKGSKQPGGIGGYNGGGTGGTDISDNDSGGGGGGATDIRLVGGNWDNEISLNSRIMVAAGGSGSTYSAIGCEGGTINGISLSDEFATQTSGNAFGIAGNGTNSSTVAGSGASGGYYGGYGGIGGGTSNPTTMGGSGSSFISGYEGCNAIKSEGDRTASNQPVHYSEIEFEDGFMQSGINDSNGKVLIFKEVTVIGKFKYTGNEQSIVLEQGNYKIQCYGAGGGYGKYNDSYKNTPGKGAFTEGILEITETTTLYIYVGQRGGDAPKGSKQPGGIGGYNGGGTGGTDISDNDSGGGGGGATDIRLVGGNWDNEISLNSRIMVAAGGSGSTYSAIGCEGGTINGISLSDEFATQTSGNAFGIAGNGTNSSTVAGSGASGGYYGGYGGIGGGTSNPTTMGGSGSSFISGYKGCNAIKSERDRTASNQPVHYSGIKFEDGFMQSGIQTDNGEVVISIFEK